MTTVYQGSPTEAERVGAESLIWKKAMRAVEYGLRVAMPGVVRTFDPATQLCTVDLTVADKLFLNNQWVNATFPTLQDVLLVLPGDANWYITFPSVVGSECLVIAADMCINSWWANGPQAAGQAANAQETDRRHDYSDPFAILAPRSLPSAIPDYSTTQLQIRSKDNATSISLDEASATVAATNVSLQGTLELSGVPAATSGATPAFTLPVTVGGVQYYLLLKDTP